MNRPRISRPPRSSALTRGRFLLTCAAIFALRTHAATAPTCIDPGVLASDATVDYGEPGHAEHPNTVRFLRLDDGTLRAEDAQTHAQLWRYRPPESLLEPEGTGPLGPLGILRFDANDDGIIDPLAGDRIWLYFGLRNRGRAYIALDASSRTRAQVLWIDRGDVLPHLGLAWAQPAIGRLRIAGSEQNSEHLVVWLAGGVPGNRQIDTPQPGVEGSRIYAVDAASGARLWHAGAAFADDAPELELPRMSFGIAAQIVPVQLDGAGDVARLYVADTGGQVWRIDLMPHQTAGTLAAGGLIASLGLAESPPVGGADAREFFAAPAIALMSPPGAPPYFAIVLGSGDALSVDSVATHDRLFAVRDFEPFAPLDAAGFAARHPILDRDLWFIADTNELSSVPASAPGWKLNLRDAGEKILNAGMIAGGVAMVPAFTPAPQSSECAQGTNRVLALRVDSARPALDLNDDGLVDARDLSIELNEKNIAPEVRVTIATPPSPQSHRDARQLDALGRQCTCHEAAEALPDCPQPGAVLRTWWRRDSVR